VKLITFVVSSDERPIRAKAKRADYPDCFSNAEIGKIRPVNGNGEELGIEVHQATGVVSAQHDISTGEALERIRAYAAKHGRPVAEIAHDVVNRRLRVD
jgi:hypothetical protein